MKKLVLISLCALVSAPLAIAMNHNQGVDFSDVETPGKIENHVLKILQQCNERCSFAQDVMEACSRKCLEKESKRSENWLVRKYTASCQGLPKVADFNFKPNDEEEIVELLETIKAYQTWGMYAQIRECAKAKLTEATKRGLSVQQRANAELEKFRKEHPVISTFVAAESAIRRKK